MIGSSYVLGAISVYQEIKIIKDLGLAAISVFGMVIAIFIGIGLVSKEMEKRTLYSVLPKPVSRSQFLLGKYFGLCLTLLVNVAVMTAGLFAGFVYVAGYFSSDLKNLESVVESAFLPHLTRVLYYVLPNFKNFDVKAAVVAGDRVPWSQLSWATAYAAIYVALLLVASCWIFRQRNLK